MTNSVQAEVRLYDRLFSDAQADAGGKDFVDAEPGKVGGGVRLCRAFIGAGEN